MSPNRITKMDFRTLFDTHDTEKNLNEYVVVLCDTHVLLQYHTGRVPCRDTLVAEYNQSSKIGFFHRAVQRDAMIVRHHLLTLVSKWTGDKDPDEFPYCMGVDVTSDKLSFRVGMIVQAAHTIVLNESIVSQEVTRNRSTPFTVKFVDARTWVDLKDASDLQLCLKRRIDTHERVNKVKRMRSSLS